MTKKQLQEKQFEILFLKAQLAGMDAAKQAQVVPMVVEQHKNMADDASPVEKSWFVEGGVCGFAWVKIKPANSPFANWLRKYAPKQTHSGYYGGLEFSIWEYGQSLQRKEAHARAMANVLSEGGINCYAQSQMD